MKIHIHKIKVETSQGEHVIDFGDWFWTLEAGETFKIEVPATAMMRQCEMVGCQNVALDRTTSAGTATSVRVCAACAEGDVMYLVAHQDDCQMVVGNVPGSVCA